MTAADLQAALDSGGAQLGVGTVTLPRPVYMSPGQSQTCELSGVGRQSVIQAAGDFDALVGIPPAIRHADPTPYLAANVLDPARWALRTGGSAGAGIRFHNTIWDMGRANWWQNWRQFTLEAYMTIHSGNGGMFGSAWWRALGNNGMIAAPVYVAGNTGLDGWVDVIFGMADGSWRLHRANVGWVPEVPFLLRVRVNLDTGTVTVEKDSVPASQVVNTSAGPIEPGDILTGNPGSPWWLGCVGTQHGGKPQGGSADVTYHAHAIWGTDTPPAWGSYNPFTWQQDKVAVAPFDSPPVAGDPAVRFTGEQDGFGYLIPFAVNDWAVGIRIRNVGVRGPGRYGAGIGLSSCLDSVIEGVETTQFAVGLRVMGLGLNNFPVTVTEFESLNPFDCGVRLQRAIARVIDLDCHYPLRSMLRADGGGRLELDDVFGAPGGQTGPTAPRQDAIYLDGMDWAKISNVVWDVEGPFAPGSYLRVTGYPAESAPMYVSITDFPVGYTDSLTVALDTTGLAAGSVIQTENSLGLPDGTYIGVRT